MTNASEKRKVVEYIVRDVYLPELKAKVTKVMNDYNRKVEKDIKLTQMTGISCNVAEPVLFEVAEPTNKLIENIMILFDDEKNIGIKTK